MQGSSAQRTVPRILLSRDRWVSVLGPPLLFFVALPLLLYAFNPAAVDVPKRTLLESGLAATAIVTATLALLGQLPGFARPLAAACDGLTATLFVLLLVPNRSGEITGLDEPFAALGNRGPLLKIAGLIALAALAHRFRPQELRALARTVIAIAAVGSLAVALFVRSAADRSREVTRDGARSLFALGGRSNVIVLVLDSFTGFRMAEIVAQRPAIRAALAGFTLYPRAIAPAHNTPAGSSAILTGDLRHAIEIEREQIRNQLSLEHSFLAEARRRGLDTAYISVLDVADSAIPSANARSLPRIESPPLAARARSYLEFLAISSARILPERAVRLLARAPSLMPLSRAGGSDAERALLDRVTNHAARSPLLGKLAFDQLLAELHEGEAESKVLFVFSPLSHPPWNFTDDGRFETGAGPFSTSIFAARSIVRLVDRLRELRAFDNALLIVASDHGTMPLLDASMGGVFAPEHELPRELNALLMVKPPRSEQPLRISKMTVWLGDVAATVRDALALPQPSSPMFESRSLLLPDDPSRVLDLPLFFRPDQVSFHSALQQWLRIDVRGTFAEFGRAASLDPNVLLARDATVVLRAGVDSYATIRAARGLREGEGTISSALIEIDGRRIAKVSSTGAVELCDAGDRFGVRSLGDAEKALASLSGSQASRNCFVAAVGIPSRLVARHLGGTAPAAREDGLVNCVFVASVRSRPRNVSRCGSGDVEVELAWR